MMPYLIGVVNDFGKALGDHGKNPKQKQNPADFEIGLKREVL